LANETGWKTCDFHRGYPMADPHSASPAFTDLEIRLLRRLPEGYPVEITLGGQQEFPRGYLSADVLPWFPGDPATDGKRLFDRLIADAKVREAWAAARGQAPRHRIRLRIDVDAPELHALPWELLQDNALTLSAGSDTPFSRYMPIALPWGGEVTERPIRVLVVISNPDDLTAKYDLPQADVALERQALEAAFGTAKNLTIDFLDALVTLERIEAALRKGYHVLHFLGHGAFNAKRQQAALYLQDADGHAQRVLDDEWVSMLARQGVQPRLVFLAACQSATRDSANAFLGLGPKLVAVGVPAVVAMQDFITVETTRKFSGVFYERLMELSLVDQAMNEARSALLTAGRPDAAVPVLFMRLKSGQLWSAEADARGKVLGVSNPRAVWTDLIETIKKGKCTPIIGSRVHGRWLPTAEEVAQRWSKAYGYPLPDQEKSMARVAQYMATTLKEYRPHREWLDTLAADFVARLPEELRPTEEYETLTELIQKVGWAGLVADDPNEPHRVLASLKLPLYLTTNCDSFMTEALAARPGIALVREICRWNKDLDSLPSRFEGSASYKPTRETPLVYHLFGTDAEARSLVITEDNYLDYVLKVSEKGRLPDYIRGVLASTSLMFIGYSLNDWDFRVLLRGLIATLNRRLDFQDVAVQLENASEADAAAVQDYLRKYFERANINVFWGGSAQFIAELREQWEASR
jgi:hypothetical protein